MPDSLQTSRRATVALIVIVTTQLMLVLDVTVVNIALVPIQHALHFTTAGLAWVLDAYTLTFGGLLLLGGRAGDMFGRRRMLMLGLTLFTAASLAGGLAQTGGLLLAARAIQGIGAAMAAPSTLSLISSIYEEGPARNRALGIFTAVSAGGGSFGLVLGGALTSWVSWRWVLIINVPIGILVVLLAPRFVPEPPTNPGRLDIPGAVLVTGGLATITYGFIRIAERASTGLTVAAFVTGIAFLAGFVLVERRQAVPLFPLRLLADRPRSASYLIIMLVPSVMFGVFFFFSQYMETGLHFSAVMAGVGFLPLTVVIFTFSRVGPRLVNRFGPRPILLFGLSLLVVATAWVSQAHPADGYFGGLFGPFLLFGLGAGSCFLPLSVTILGGVPRDDAGAASGMLQTMQQTGAALGIAALTSIAVSHGRAAALLTGTGIICVALVVALVFVRPTTPPETPTPETLALELEGLPLME